MPDHEESRRIALRPVTLNRSAAEDDATASLREAIEGLDAKLHAAGGFAPVSAWARQAERLLGGVSDAEIEVTRKEIRELIDRLLELNAQVQTLVRLKLLLS